ncbi:hypothetical protein HYC85_002729 [Camellia sinensis]|uniref:Uncharacterized protein n=1 Tax=Camellia sinensis TaxID=4442 RepID=A0A7J7I946_CAMSI|nr:hypothetical protein HYC85_002729 [Camellia sinensis]
MTPPYSVLYMVMTPPYSVLYNHAIFFYRKQISRTDLIRHLSILPNHYENLFIVLQIKYSHKIFKRNHQLLHSGIPLRIVMAIMEKGLPLAQIAGGLSQGIIAWASYISVLADVLPGETLLWKLQMLGSASLYVNAHLGAVKAQTLILSSSSLFKISSPYSLEKLTSSVSIKSFLHLLEPWE